MAIGRPFKKGETGNPGGKPNFSKILIEVGKRYGVDPLTPGALRIELVKFHVDVMRDAKAHMRERQRSADWLAAHVGLKPREVFEHHFGERTADDLAHMSDEELDAYIATAESRAAVAKAEADAEQTTDDPAVG
jgi:hypothetical protein